MKETENRVPTAQRLRQAMDAAGKKQFDLAKATGLSHSTISRYLSGQMEPKQKAVALMAVALDVSEMWLWGYDVPMSRSTEQKKNDQLAILVAQLRNDPDFLDVVSQLAALPPEQYASVKTILAALGQK